VIRHRLSNITFSLALIFVASACSLPSAPTTLAEDEFSSEGELETPGTQTETAISPADTVEPATPSMTPEPSPTITPTPMPIPIVALGLIPPSPI
jgi:hypothetical protein